MKDFSKDQARIDQMQLLPDQSKGNFPLESVHIKFATSDTAEITQIYMQRPTSLAAFKLGQWFNRAHGLKDFELEQAASALETKLLIVRKGFNSLSLAPLKAYNEGAEKNQKSGGVKP